MSTFKATTVIGLYKRLHRTSQRVFNGDDSAIRVASNKIRSEYEKNRRVANGPAVAELIQLGLDCDKILREQVFQAEKVADSKYRLKIRDDNLMIENTPFQDNITDEQYKQANRKGKSKCSNRKPL